MFSDFIEQLKKKENTENCVEKFEEMNDPIFEFDFSNKKKIEIFCNYQKVWGVPRQTKQNKFND